LAHLPNIIVTALGDAVDFINRVALLVSEISCRMYYRCFMQHHNLHVQQILLCATRQFKEGDIQHWWHPPIGRGVRTHISDDFLWLPFVTSLYISYTEDSAILDEVSPFLEGRLLN
jgi:hypothetical protein